MMAIPSLDTLDIEPARAAIRDVFMQRIVHAKGIDRALVRRLRLSPDAMTRYSVVRRTIVAAVIVVGGLSALLVIPEVRAVASSRAAIAGGSSRPS